MQNAGHDRWMYCIRSKLGTSSPPQKEYDSYVSSLLDSQRDKHKVLYSQVEQLSSRGTSNPEMLHHEVRTVNILQATAREKLAENER